MNYLVFDLETQALIDQSNREKSIKDLRVSVAVTYNSLTNQYTIYSEEDLLLILDELLTADMIIGMNLFGFDYKVLAKYFPELDLETLPTLDIHHNLLETTSNRISLENLSTHTVGKGKSGTGIEAVTLFHNGEMMELIEYCKRDVEVTKEIYEFGKKRGFVKFRDKDSHIQTVKVNWDHE